MKLSLKTALLSLIVLAGAGIASAQLPSLSAAIDKIFTDGVAAYKAGNYDTAIERYSAFLRSRPNDHHAWYNRGLAYFKKAEYAKAADDFSKAVALDANYTEAFTQRARSYNELASGDLQRYSALAIADFSKAISLRPNAAGLYRERGQAYLKVRENVKALADIDNVIRLGEKNADTYYLRGKIKFDGRSYTEAGADLREAIRLDPQHTAARSLLQTNAARLPKTTAAARPTPAPRNTTPTARATPKPSSTPKPLTSTAGTSAGSTGDVADDIREGKAFLSAKQPDKAIAAFQRALAKFPKQAGSPDSVVSLLFANQAADLERHIAEAYLQKRDAATSLQKCIDLEEKVFAAIMAPYGKINNRKLQSSALMEIFRINIDGLLREYDLLENETKRSVEIVTGCVKMHLDLPASDDPEFKRMFIGITRAEIAKFAAEMFRTGSELNLTMLEFCDGKGAGVCGSRAAKNESAKYKARAFSYINAAIETFPNLRSSYATRAKLYRYTGQNALAAADEAKANEP